MAESDIFEVPHGMALMLDVLKSLFCEMIVAEVESAYFFAILNEQSNNIIAQFIIHEFDTFESGSAWY